MILFTAASMLTSKYEWLLKEILDATQAMERLYSFKADNLRRMITEQFLIGVSEKKEFTLSIGLMPFARFYAPHLRSDPIVLAIGVDFWKRLPSIEDKAFVLAHEIGHLMMEHIWRTEAWKDAGLTPMERNFIFDCTVHEAFPPTLWIEQTIKPVTRKSLFLDRGIPAEPKRSSDYYATLYIQHRPPIPQMSDIWMNKIKRELNREDEKEVIDKIADDIIETIKEEITEERYPVAGKGGGLTQEQKEEIKKNARKLIEELRNKSDEEIKKALDEYKKNLKHEMEQVIQKPPPPEIAEKFAGAISEKKVKEIIDINSIIEYREYNWAEVFRRLIGEVFNRVMMEETWARPWKKTGYPPGVIYYPPAKIGMVIDVSGSMASCIDEIAGEIKHAVMKSRAYNIEWIVVEVDATVRRIYKITPEWSKFGIGVPGGGTVIGKGILALNEAIEMGNYSAVIIATDGFLFDKVLPVPRTNLVIVLYPKEHASIKDYFPRRIPIVEIVVKKEKKFVKG